MPATAACWPNMPASGGSIIAHPGRSQDGRRGVPVAPRTRTSTSTPASTRGHRPRRRCIICVARRASDPQGASTITQQVAKNFLLTNEQTFDRKIKETAPRAAHRERPTPRTRSSSSTSTKSTSGLGNYGIAAASLNYYGKSVHELTLAEAAYLAALPKAPNNYHPVPLPRGGDRAAQLRHRSHGRERLRLLARTAKRRRRSRSTSIRARFRRTPSPPASLPRKSAANSPTATARRSFTRAASRSAPRSIPRCS